MISANLHNQPRSKSTLYLKIKPISIKNKIAKTLPFNYRQAVIIL
jgi:hypothetical protein